MFDTFFKPKFYTKCKSCLKMTKTRLDAIRKKKNAVQKFLKNDIVDLLKNGLDYNAYGRAEGLLIERNVLSCYELIDEFCGTISNQFAGLNKQRECPDECREAVGSLIYATARFSDLPELRDLRSLFTERYGSSFEAFTCKEFVDKLRAVPVTKEMKLELLQEIAQESSIEWDPKALEQQLYTPPQDEPKISPTDKESKNNVAPVPEYGRKTNSRGRKDISDDDSLFDSSSEDNTTENSTRDGSTDQDIQIQRGVSEEAESQKPFYLRFIPPPYLKPKPEKKEAILEEPSKVIDHVNNDESNKHHKSIPEEKPKPRSVRQRNSRRTLPVRENINDIGNDGEKNTSSNRIEVKEITIPKEKGPRDGKDNEERMLDGLLMHYSKKKSSYESNIEKGNMKSLGYRGKDNAESQRNVSIEDEDVAAPARAALLPSDSSAKRHARTSSLQPDNGHVHPKLPDYDQLAARFAALKGK